MYINQIDELLSRILDDFYNLIILKDPRIDKIINEVNFVKYQKEINDIMASYMSTINIDEIRNLINNEDNVQMIIEIIKRYIAYYLFLTVGFFFKGKTDI